MGAVFMRRGALTTLTLLLRSVSDEVRWLANDGRRRLTVEWLLLGCTL
jgi:hypothetical protein